MKEYNKSMSEVRVAVEWLFGDVIKPFKFMDFKKIDLSNIGKMYIVRCVRLSSQCYDLSV